MFELIFFVLKCIVKTSYIENISWGLKNVILTISAKYLGPK